MEKEQNLFKRTLWQLFMDGNIMLWGCVAASGAGNIAWIEGRMDSTEDQQILDANVKKMKLKKTLQ